MESVMYLIYVYIYGSMGNLKIKPGFSVLYIWTEQKEYIKILFQSWELLCYGYGEIKRDNEYKKKA